MTQYIEDFLPPVMDAGLNTAENTSLGGTLSVTGATTLASTLAVSGAATFASTPTVTGGITRSVSQSALVGATVVLTAADSGGVFINRSTSGSPSWTLPTAAAGLYYTFYVSNVTAGFTVTGGTIKAKTSASGTAISGTTLTNTQGTAVIGDNITLLCDGTNWIAISQSGIFAAS